jgi:hypothetical protein
MSETIVTPPVEHLAMSRPVHRVMIWATVAGVLLGVLDLLGQQHLPYPWANLANSSAAWAIGAFAFGMWARTSLKLAAASGIWLLLLAVESYYLAAVLLQHDSTSTLWSTSTRVWLVLAVLAGGLFGGAGALARSAGLRDRCGAAALAGMVFLAEALATLHRSPRSGGFDTDHQTALIDLVLALLVPVLVLMVGRRGDRPGVDRQDVARVGG